MDVTTRVARRSTFLEEGEGGVSSVRTEFVSFSVIFVLLFFLSTSQMPCGVLR